MCELSQHLLLSMKIEDIFEAYYSCRSGKRKTKSAIAYEIDYERKLLALMDRVNKRTYYPSTSICFVVTRPRYREVFAAEFEDRIIHHWVVNRLEPIFEAMFSERTFSCRKGKGQLFGVNRLKADLLECSNNYKKDCYIMKIDLKGFFMSINKPMMAKMIDNLIVNQYKGSDIEDLRFICKVITLHKPEENCERHSPMEYWNYLPKNKSLFTCGEELGLAIGNIFVQHYANFLLNQFDWYIEKLGIKYHGRYVDDTYLIHESKEKLLACISPIRKFLAKFCLQLNENKFYIQHYTKGVQFTGAIIKPYRTYCGKRTINNFKRAVKRLNNAKNVKQIEESVCSINSYLGLLRQYNEYNNRKKILGMINKWILKFVYIKGHYEVLVLKKKYRKKWHG